MSHSLVIPSTLSEKQKAFCRAYLVSLNASDAYRKAGYSENGANSSSSALMALPSIKAYITAKLRQREAAEDVTADYVLSGIKGVVERCDGAEDSANQLRGLELLGKYKRLFSDTAPEIQVNLQVIAPTADPEQAARVYKEMME